MFVSHDSETSLTQLSRKGGGAAIMKTTTGLVIALYTKDKKCIELDGSESKKKVQSNGGCAGQVQAMAEYLIDQGY